MDSHHRTMTPSKCEEGGGYRATRHCASQSNPVKNPISIFDVCIEGGGRRQSWKLKWFSESPNYAQTYPGASANYLSHKMRNRNEINSPSEPQEIKPSPDRALPEFLNLVLLPPTSKCVLERELDKTRESLHKLSYCDRNVRNQSNRA